MANLDDDRTSSAHAFLKFGKCAVPCFVFVCGYLTQEKITVCFVFHALFCASSFLALYSQA